MSLKQNQPFKKRIIEHRSQQQYYHYESVAESVPPQQQQHHHQQQQQQQQQQQNHLQQQQQNHHQQQQILQQQPLQHLNQQQFVQYHQPILRQHLQQHHHHEQQQYQQSQQHVQPIQPPQQEMIDNVEKPMTLNVWTQTKIEDFASLSNKNEIALLKNISELEQTVRAQNEFIIQLKKECYRTPSPPQDVPNSTTITPTSVKHDGTRYRILAQASDDEVNSSESQIEIEFSDDAVSHNLNFSTDSDRLEICLSDESEMSPRTPEGSQKIQHLYPGRPDLENATVSIGPCGTQILVSAYEQMSWTSASLATRKLLSLIFDRETLATHSMTGKASPAFRDLDKPIKGKLDPDAIQDIIFIVSKKCGVSPKEVRSAITTKCADENKLSKLQALKKMNYPVAKRPILRDLKGMNSEDY